jgi:hypothetical protein
VRGGEKVTREQLKQQLGIHLSDEQYGELAILDACTKNYTAVDLLKLLKIIGLLPTKSPDKVSGQ